MPRELSSITPEEIAAALAEGGRRLRVLARVLLSLTVTLAGRELHPFGSRYDRQPGELRNDVAQDVMVKVFADGGRVLRAWQPQLGLSLRGFIKRVVRYHVLALFRTERGNPWRNAPAEPEEIDGLGSSQPGLLHQLWLWQVRDLLLEDEPLRGRELYRALFVEHRSADETAGALGMTRDAVYQWKARFKQRAARILARNKPLDAGPGEERSR